MVNIWLIYGEWWLIVNNIWLVVRCAHLEKWWSESQWGWDDIPSISEMESHKIHVPNHQPEYLAINEKDNVIVNVIMMMRSLRFAGAKSILCIIPVVETASNSFRRNRYSLLNMTSSFCGPWFDRLQQARISEISNKRDSLYPLVN